MDITPNNSMDINSHCNHQSNMWNNSSTMPVCWHKNTETIWINRRRNNNYKMSRNK